MFFVISKIFWTIGQPLNAISALMAFGLLVRLKWRNAGQKMVVTSVFLLLLCGVLPIGPALMVWLERQYPPVTSPMNADGIIVLGGAFESHLSLENGKLNANNDIGRMFCAVELAKLNPKAKLVFTGGSGDILNPALKEGDDVRSFVNLIDFKHQKILFEEESKNTYENALYSKKMLNPAAEENWVLVTSAYHMPRSVGVFEKTGWKVIPYSCGQKTDGKYAGIFKKLPSMTTNFTLLNIATKEILGSMIYYVTGKSAFFLLPARVVSPDETNN